MRRIGLVAPPFESIPPRLYGGTERVVCNLARGLAESGLEVILFASADSTLSEKHRRIRTIPVVDKALRLRAEPVEDPVPYHFQILGAVAENAEEVDLIHNHHDFWMLPLQRMTQVPMLTTLHGRLDLPDIGVAFSAFPDVKMISISDSQRVPMPQLNWLRTIYHGIDLSEFVFHERPGTYLAFLGRIHPEKKPEWAIEIAKQAGIPLKIAAKIEGKIGRDYYDAFVRPHVDGKFIEFVGEISDAEKSDFLGNALGLVFPIDWPEPFGLVTIEALACGTPVLARPCGSARELLQEGVTGFIHADLTRLALSVQDLPQIDRRQCRRWVEERFSLQRMTKDYIDVYRTLTETDSVRGGPPPRASLRGAAAHRRRWHLLHSVQRSADRNS